MENVVINLKAQNGTLYTVRVTFEDAQQTKAKIMKVIKIDPKQSGPLEIPNGVYRNDNGWPIKVSGDSLTLVKPGVAPQAKRVPLSGIAKLMEEGRASRKAYVSEARMNGLI